MDPSALAAVVEALETAVLEYQDDGRFIWLGPVPAWWQKVWGECVDSGSGIDLNASSLFLENFMIDAEEHWTSPGKGRLRSGVWYETDAAGEEWQLEASAVGVDGRRVLLVELLGNEGDERQQLIQKGRENQLRFLQDLARHEKTEEFLHQIQVELEVQVAARTAELQREVGERKRVAEGLRVSLQEKEILLQEIHHRVKNNLQIITSLLDLQSRFSADEGIEEILMDSRNRVQSMALIHEKLYQSHQLTHIDLRDYIHTLAAELFDVYQSRDRHIELQIEAEDVSLDIANAISCGLILNELIANALKHAFPEGQGGKIRVYLHTGDAGKIVMGVQDNGVGLPPEVDPDNARSLGLTLMRQLVHQLRGGFEVNRDRGTDFGIAFVPAD